MTGGVGRRAQCGKSVFLRVVGLVAIFSPRGERKFADSQRVYAHIAARHRRGAARTLILACMLCVVVAAEMLVDVVNVSAKKKL